MQPHTALINFSAVFLCFILTVTTKKSFLIHTYTCKILKHYTRLKSFLCFFVVFLVLRGEGYITP